MQPTADSTRKPHRGTTRCLVIAIDVGTTFSGVSYAILEPGEVPKIHGVTRFPGQEHVAGNSKIPTIMYYDKSGTMKAAGAEAESASILSKAEDEGWVKTELFKLRLRPKSMKLDMNGMRLSPLPRNKSATHVFGDFLSYLFHCTRNFIKDTHANGEALWNAVERDLQFVLSHPNGWEGAQQMRIRKAAVYGGLIPNTSEGKARIRFVTEGEASLHACVLNGLAADVLSNTSNPGFIVVDAGGGTLDISSYAIRGTAPLTIEEIAPPDCIFAGSVFVSHRARVFLTEKLKNSKYGSADSVEHITKKFDETTKRLFRDRTETQYIAFGSPFDKDATLGIRSGQLKLTGAEVAELFEPSVEAAVASIKAQIDASAGLVQSVWLVGGFAASPYLFKQLQERLAPLGIVVSRPDNQTSKAVADGAIGFYCDHHVSTRMSKFMYGVEYLREFDPKDADHVARRVKLCELPSGPKLLPDAFDCILARRIKVKESTVFTRKYCTELTSLSTLSFFEVDVWCYRGGDTIPKWILRDSSEFSTLCVVRADLSPLTGSAQAKQSKNGKSYWTIIFSVEIQFGLTEFKARIKWIDNGETKYGPATIVYNEGGHSAEDEDADSGPEDDGFADAEQPPISRSRGSPVPTSGYASPKAFSKTISTPGPLRPEVTTGASASAIESPRIERSMSKTEPASPHPLPKASALDTTARREEREKGKGKLVSASTSASASAAAEAAEKAKAELALAREEEAKTREKDKAKESSTTSAAEKKASGKKAAKKDQDDSVKAAESSGSLWDTPVTAAESTFIGTSTKQTVETPKEEKETKTAKKKAKKTAAKVGFALPDIQESPAEIPPLPSQSPIKPKSPIIEPSLSHSSKHETIDFKNEVPLDTNPVSDTFDWDTKPSSWNAAYSQDTGDYNYDETNNVDVDEVPIDSWDNKRDFDNPDLYSSSHANDMYNFDRTEPLSSSHAPDTSDFGFTNPLSFSDTLDFGTRNSFSIDLGLSPDTTSPQNTQSSTAPTLGGFGLSGFDFSSSAGMFSDTSPQTDTALGSASKFSAFGKKDKDSSTAFKSSGWSGGSKRTSQFGSGLGFFSGAGLAADDDKTTLATPAAESYDSWSPAAGASSTSKHDTIATGDKKNSFTFGERDENPDDNKTQSHDPSPAADAWSTNLSTTATASGKKKKAASTAGSKKLSFSLGEEDENLDDDKKVNVESQDASAPATSTNPPATGKKDKRKGKKGTQLLSEQDPEESNTPKEGSQDPLASAVDESSSADPAPQPSKDKEEPHVDTTAGEPQSSPKTRVEGPAAVTEEPQKDDDLLDDLTAMLGEEGGGGGESDPEDNKKAAKTNNSKKGKDNKGATKKKGKKK